VRFKLAAYVEEAAKSVPSLRSNVTPHSFRHATAVHLVAAGVDITHHPQLAGDISLDTTNHYAQANLDQAKGAGTGGCAGGEQRATFVEAGCQSDGVARHPMK
jgi:hypothetical protein